MIKRSYKNRVIKYIYLYQVEIISNKEKSYQSKFTAKILKAIIEYIVVAWVDASVKDDYIGVV